MSMLALHPAPAPARPRMLMIGTALTAAAGTMLFGAMLGVYLNRRDAAGGSSKVFSIGMHYPMVACTTALVTLLMSSVMMQWAVYAIKRNDRMNCYVALGLTGILGLLYLNAMAFIYKSMGLSISRTPYAVMVYAITGTHVVVTIGSLGFVALMAFRALGGRYNAKEHEGITAAAMFWHWNVVMFCAVWYVVFVVK